MLLQDRPDRVQAELSRLGVRFTLHPVYEDGEQPYLRATGEGNFEIIAGADFPATGRSLQRSGR